MTTATPLLNAAAQPRTVRSYVRREGRITPAQRAALEHLWPRYGLEPRPGAELDMPAIFGRRAPLAVEIGFGSGSQLLASAQARPDTDFLGIEVHRPGVGRVLLAAEQAGYLANLRVICADAVEVLREALTAASADEVLDSLPRSLAQEAPPQAARLIQPVFRAAAGAGAAARRPPSRLGALYRTGKTTPITMLAVLDAEAQFANSAGAPAALRRACRPSACSPASKAAALRLGHAVFDLEFTRL